QTCALPILDRHLEDRQVARLLLLANRLEVADGLGEHRVERDEVLDQEERLGLVLGVALHPLHVLSAFLQGSTRLVGAGARIDAQVVHQVWAADHAAELVRQFQMARVHRAPRTRRPCRSGCTVAGRPGSTRTRAPRSLTPRISPRPYADSALGRLPSDPWTSNPEV